MFCVRDATQLLTSNNITCMFILMSWILKELVFEGNGRIFFPRMAVHDVQHVASQVEKFEN